MKIKDITQYLEQIAPRSYQESYDNAGLLTGNAQDEVNGVLISLDSTEDVVEEAIKKDCNLIVAHHPIIFKGLKKLSGNDYVTRTVTKAIRNNIAIYAIHTNLDNVHMGVNRKIANKLHLKNVRVLRPKPGTLLKLIAFIPVENTQEVLDAMHAAGAGNIGNYERCSFRIEGTGAFQPTDEANPHIGNHNELEYVNENRVEVIIPAYAQNSVLSALREAHPYEEVAYFLHEIENENQEVGSGMIGELEAPMAEDQFIEHLKTSMELHALKATRPTGRAVKQVAVCGGAGSFLLQDAIKQQADVFVSSDFKYHEFFDADGHLMILDIGHYESEVFTKELIFEELKEKFTNFAVHLSQVNTNPVQYR